MKRTYDNWKMRGDGEETGGVETQCPSKRHGRVIFNSDNECHECADRRDEAMRIRQQRKEIQEMAWRHTEIQSGARVY